MIGVNLYTVHAVDGLCDSTVGVYVLHAGFAGGVLRNSECGTSGWFAWAPESNVVTFGPVKAKAGLLLGAITGYRAADVLPMVSPSVAVGWRETWLRLSYLPRSPGAVSDGWHLSIEYGF